MRQVLDCIITRRSIRKYTEQQIPLEALESILEGARFAPSGSNMQLWHFTAIQKADILTDLNKAIRTESLALVIDDTTPQTKKTLHTRAQAPDFAFCFNAPTLIIASNERTYPNAMADCACALQNMLLMAHALDLGACWINACHWLTDTPAVRALYTRFGIPESHIVCGSVAVGYRAEALPKAPTRKENTTFII